MNVSIVAIALYTSHCAQCDYLLQIFIILANYRRLNTSTRTTPMQSLLVTLTHAFHHFMFSLSPFVCLSSNWNKLQIQFGQFQFTNIHFAVQSLHGSPRLASWPRSTERTSKVTKATSASQWRIRGQCGLMTPSRRHNRRGKHRRTARRAAAMSGGQVRCPQPIAMASPESSSINGASWDRVRAILRPTPKTVPRGERTRQRGAIN